MLHDTNRFSERGLSHTTKNCRYDGNQYEQFSGVGNHVSFGAFATLLALILCMATAPLNISAYSDHLINQVAATPDYLVTLILLIFTFACIILCIVNRVPLLGFVVGILSFFIGALTLSNSDVPLDGIMQMSTMLIGVVCILYNGLEFRK